MDPKAAENVNREWCEEQIVTSYFFLIMTPQLSLKGQTEK